MSFENTTPIIPGFHSDPTVCFARGRWYLAVSSFEYFPAAPIYVSDDFADWSLLGHVIDRPEQLDFSGTDDSMGIYGSTLRFHDEQFWFITTDVTTLDRGQLLFHTADPAGPWSEPVRVPAAVGIDPDIAWDADGRAILTWASMNENGQSRLLQADFDTSTGALTSPVRPIWNGTGMRNPEGPHLLEWDGWWYLIVAEGGTDRGHSVSLARAPSPRGPFTPSPRNPALTHRSSAHPVQSVGHADLVAGPSGVLTAVYHGTRPAGQFPEFHVLGRETFAADVTRTPDGWLEIVERDRVTVPAGSFTDHFTDARRSLHWVTPGSNQLIGQPSEEGLQLRTADAGQRPLLRRVTSDEWTATATFRIEDGRARLVLRLDDRHWCAVEVTADAVSSIVTIGPAGKRTGQPRTGSEITVAIRAVRGEELSFRDRLRRGPDRLELSVIDAGTWHVLESFDGRYLSTEVAGGFTGRMVGVQHVAGTGTLTRFTFAPRSVLPLPSDDQLAHAQALR